MISCFTLRKNSNFAFGSCRFDWDTHQLKTKNRGTLPLPMAGHNNGKWNDRRPHDSS